MGILAAGTSKETRFLITGLNGLVGWHLFCRAQREFTVFGTYRKRHAALCGGNLFRMDMEEEGEIRALFEFVRPHYVLHAWAMCDLDLCESIPEMAYRINVEGTRKMLQAAAGFGRLRRFVYLSTDHVFDGESGPYTEEDIPKPKHVYGRTKRAAELLVAHSGLPHLMIRPGLVIGPSFQGNKGPRDFLLSRIHAHKPTHLFTDEWRTPIRAEALAEEVIRLTVSGAEGLFHVYQEKSISRYALGRKLAAEEGLSPKMIFPRLRKEDKWARIRPRNLSLKSTREVLLRNP